MNFSTQYSNSNAIPTATSLYLSKVNSHNVLVSKNIPKNDHSVCIREKKKIK